MFRIRTEQLWAFEAVAMESFERRGIVHLRSFLPEHTASSSDDQLRERIRDGLARARRYLLETEWEVMCFVDTSVLLGDRFDADQNHEWARAILDDRDEPPERRAVRLLECAECIVGLGRPSE